MFGKQKMREQRGLPFLTIKVLIQQAVLRLTLKILPPFGWALGKMWAVAMWPMVMVFIVPKMVVKAGKTEA